MVEKPVPPAAAVPVAAVAFPGIKRRAVRVALIGAVVRPVAVPVMMSVFVMTHMVCCLC